MNTRKKHLGREEHKASSPKKSNSPQKNLFNASNSSDLKLSPVKSSKPDSQLDSKQAFSQRVDDYNAFAINNHSNNNSSVNSVSSLKNYLSETSKDYFNSDRSENQSKTSNIKKIKREAEVNLSGNIKQSGAFGTVFQYYHLAKNQISILKSMKDDDENKKSAILKEIEIYEKILEQQNQGTYKELIEILDSGLDEKGEPVIKLEYGYTDIQNLLDILYSCIFTKDSESQNKKIDGFSENISIKEFEQQKEDSVKQFCMNYFKLSDQKVNFDILFKLQYENSKQISLLSDLNIFHNDNKLDNTIITAEQKSKLIDYNLSKVFSIQTEYEKMEVPLNSTNYWPREWKKNGEYMATPFKVDIFRGVYYLEGWKDKFFTKLKNQNNNDSTFILDSYDQLTKFQDELKQCNTCLKLKKILQNYEKKYTSCVGAVNSQLEQIMPLFYSDRMDFDSLRDLIYVHNLPSQAIPLAISHGKVLEKNNIITPIRTVFKAIELVAAQRGGKLDEFLKQLQQMMKLFVEIKKQNLDQEKLQDAYKSQVDLCLLLETILRKFGINGLALELTKKAEKIYENNLKSNPEQDNICENKKLKSVIKYGNCIKEVCELHNLLKNYDEALEQAEKAIGILKLKSIKKSSTDSHQQHSTNENQESSELELKQVTLANLQNQICVSLLNKFDSQKQKMTKQEKLKIMISARKYIDEKKKITDNIGDGSTLSVWTHFNEGRILQLEGKFYSSLESYNKALKVANQKQIYKNKFWYWYIFLRSCIAKFEMGNGFTEDEGKTITQLIPIFESFKIEQEEVKSMDEAKKQGLAHLKLYGIEFPDVDDAYSLVVINLSLQEIQQLFDAFLELIGLVLKNTDKEKKEVCGIQTQLIENNSRKTIENSLNELKISEKLEQLKKELEVFLEPVLYFEF